MAEVELSRLPTGELGWSKLIDFVVESDDRIERYFLEVKSEIDLNNRSDRAKVAKFILGAANRDPEQAKRRFGGHALMVLGVGGGKICGVPPFETKDISRSIQKFIGADGPGWDYERVRVGDLDVIVIVTDPPTGDLWTCRADGDGLVDGGIYVRQDGETRRATGDEIRLLIERATHKDSRVDVDVAIDGEVRAIQFDASAITDYAKREAARYREQVSHSRLAGSYGLSAIAALDVRSPKEFLNEVAAWENAALESPDRGIVTLTAQLCGGIQVRLRNLTRTFLRDVRLDIAFEDNVLAADWEEFDKKEPIELLPGRPEDWGSRSWISDVRLGVGRSNTISPVNTHGLVLVKRERPAMLTMHLSSLRPEEEHVSDDDEVVLVMTSTPSSEIVRARWRVTAQGINDVFEGGVEIPVSCHDLRDPIAGLIRSKDED